MGLGKTYSADYLIDSNGNTGVSGQVLISTATGIDWADGSAITGGPFLPLAGGTITGNVRFNDTFKAEFGSSADLQINHDATDSLINNATGHLTIRNGANDKNIFLQADNGSGGNTSYLTLNGANTHAYFSNPGNVGIGTTDPGAKLDVNVTDDTFNDINVLKLKRTWATASGSDRAHGISFNDANSNNATIYVDRTNSGANYNSDLLFATNTGTSGTSVSTKMVIKADGNVGIGTDTPIDELHVEGVIQSKKQLLPSTSSTAGWYKIGTMSGFVQGGATAVLEIAGHQGYNATNNQDYLIKLFIKTSNASSTGPDGQGFNSWYERTGGNNATIEFKWNNSATNDYDLYMFIPTHSLRSWYSVKKGTGTWEHAGTSATDPGANSSAVLKATGLFNILDANVGIGTTAPSQKLTVVGNTYVSSGLLLLDNNQDIRWGDAGERITGHNTNGLVFTTNNFETMRINSQGKVGIGTTDPGSLLQVGGLDDGSNYDITLGWNAVDSEAVGTKRSAITFKTGQTSVNTEDIYKWDIAMLAAPATVTGEEFGSDLAFLRSTRGSTATDATTMILTRTGNVGIGTTAPTGKLEIQRSQVTTQFDRDCFLRLHPTATTNSGGFTNIMFGTSTTNNYGVAIGGRKAGTGDTSSNNKPEFSVRILNDGITGTEVLNINTEGNATFAGKLDVVVSNVSVTPNADSSAVFRKNGHNYISILSGGTNEGGVIFGNSADAADGYIAYKHGTGAADQAFAFGTANGERMRITKGGNVGIGTTAPTSSVHINGLQTNSGSTSASIPTGTMRLNFAGASSTNEYGASLVFTQRWWTNSTAEVAMGQIAGVKETGNGNYGGGLAFFTSNNTSNNLLERLRINKLGNVGIGTTSPSSKLQVSGDAYVTEQFGQGVAIANKIAAYGGEFRASGASAQIFFGRSGSSVGSGAIGADSTYVFRVWTTPGFGNPFVIKQDGNVGIGTTSPTATLNVKNSSATALPATSGTAQSASALRVDNGNVVLDFGSHSSNGASWIQSSLVSNLATTFPISLNPNGGNVGIGTTSPVAKLDVNGDIAVKGASIINKASAALTIGDIAGNDSVTNLTLTTAGRSTEVFLDDSGNVGVNTATPSYNLTVDSGANDIGIVTASSDSGSYVGFLDNTTSTIPKVGAVGNKLILDASQYVGVRKTNPSYALDVNGTIRATGNVIAYSDARVKENVETIPNALDKVKAMRGVGYNKIGEEKRSIGVIAQEMLEVMPEVVSQDEQGMYSVAYGNLVGVLIEAVKEQQQQIDELKKQIK